MNILVTGGAGFIGSHLVDCLLELDEGLHSVTVLDNLAYAGNLLNLDRALKNNRFKFVEGDITSKTDVMKAMIDITHVINAAAESHVDRSISGPLAFIETNVVGTSVLLDAALRSGVEVFLQVSTDEVYGSIPVGQWNEDTILDPHSPYSASKASADLIALAFHSTYNLDVRISRCCNNYGTRQYPEKIIPFFVKKASEGEKLPLYGSGENIREWIHVNDHCLALVKILTEGKPGEIYNVGSGFSLSNFDLANLILKELNLKSEEYIEFVDDRKGHDFRYSLNFEKISRELDFRCKRAFYDEIPQIIDWYKSNSAVPFE